MLLTGLLCVVVMELLGERKQKIYPRLEVVVTTQGKPVILVRFGDFGEIVVGRYTREREMPEGGETFPNSEESRELRESWVSP